MSRKEFQIEFNKLLSNLYKKCRFKGCVFPDKSNCSKKPIKAHSIQKNKILKHISINGMVISGDIQKTLFTQEFEEVGINSASVFFGFCNYHDTSIFSEIENQDYIENQEQNFLYAYRACALEYVKKIEASCLYKGILKRYKNTQKEIYLKNMVSGANLGLVDLTEILDDFSNELIKQRDIRNYNIIYTQRFALQYEALIAVNSFFYIQYDFEGNLINDLSNPSKIPAPIFLNVFPQNGKTIILFSCLSKDQDIYRNILSNLENISNSRIEYFFSNLIINHCENLFMSPLKYNMISKKMRILFVKKFMKTIREKYPSDYLTSGSMNLLKKLKC